MEMYHKSKRKDENLPLSPSSNADEFNLKFYFSSSTVSVSVCFPHSPLEKACRDHRFGGELRAKP